MKPDVNKLLQESTYYSSDNTVNEFLRKIIMKSNDKNKMPLWKWIAELVVGLLVFILLYAFLQSTCMSVGNPWLKLVLPLIGGAVMLGCYALYIKAFEKRAATEISIKKVAKDILEGLLIGGLFMSLVVAILAIFGVYRIDHINFNAYGLLLGFVFYFLVASGEEIICRGVIFGLIDRRFNIVVALIVSAFTFGFAHIAQVNFATAVAISLEAGFMFAAAYKLKNSLWLPIGIHWMWNFTLGSIYGVNVSGLPQEPLLLAPQISGPEILTGGANGFEGSIVACILGVLLGVLFLYLRKRKAN